MPSKVMNSISNSAENTALQVTQQAIKVLANWVNANFFHKCLEDSKAIKEAKKTAVLAGQ